MSEDVWHDVDMTNTYCQYDGSHCTETAEHDSMCDACRDDYESNLQAAADNKNNSARDRADTRRRLQISISLRQG